MNHYVYIIAKVIDPNADVKFGSPVKVGVSSQCHCRLDTLQTATPFKIEIFQTFAFADRSTAFEIENTVHRALKAKRLHGEWFDVSPQAAMLEVGVGGLNYAKKRHGIQDDEGRARWIAKAMGFDPDAYWDWKLSTT